MERVCQEEVHDLSLGHGFKPTDEELIDFLRVKFADVSLKHNTILDIDLYRDIHTPNSLAVLYPLIASEEGKVWYFYTRRDRKHTHGGERINRTTNGGVWKNSIKFIPIRRSDHEVIGYKQCLVFHKNNPTQTKLTKTKTDWVMYEYGLDKTPARKRKRRTSEGDIEKLDDWVMCKIYEMKSRKRTEEHPWTLAPSTSMDDINKVKQNSEGKKPRLFIRRKEAYPSVYKGKKLGDKCALKRCGIYFPYIPSFIHPLIHKLTNVPMDGHCGFHALALGLQLNQREAWKHVRHNLVKELELRPEFYNYLWGAEDSNKHRQRLDYYGSAAANPNWIELPAHGILVANSYNCAFFIIGKKACTTFLPMFSAPPSDFEGNMFGLAYLEEASHYIHVEFKRNVPIPPVTPEWEFHCIHIAETWLTPLNLRMKAWEVIREPFLEN